MTLIFYIKIPDIYYKDLLFSKVRLILTKKIRQIDKQRLVTGKLKNKNAFWIFN